MRGVPDKPGTPKGKARQPEKKKEIEDFRPGHLYEYVSNAQEIGECPKNKRRGVDGESIDGEEINVLFDSDLDFDYTMVGRMEGVRLDVDVRIGYLANPGIYSLQAVPAPLLSPALEEELETFTTPPLFMEENTHFYNHAPRPQWQHRIPGRPRHQLQGPQRRARAGAVEGGSRGR